MGQLMRQVALCFVRLAILLFIAQNVKDGPPGLKCLAILNAINSIWKKKKSHRHKFFSVLDIHGLACLFIL